MSNTRPRLLSPQVSKEYGLCVAELEKWQSAIQRDAAVCSEAKRQHNNPGKKTKISLSMIDSEGNFRDSKGLCIAMIESSAKYFQDMERRKNSEDGIVIPRVRGKTTSAALVSRKIKGPDTGLVRATTVPVVPPPKRPLPKVDKPTFQNLLATRRSSSTLNVSRDSINLFTDLRLHESEVGQIIMGGTKERLTDILTNEKLTDLGYVGEFLITYHYFTSCSEILTHLEESIRSNNEEVQWRVKYILEKWMSNYAIDFYHSKTIEKLSNVLKLFPDDHSIHPLFEGNVLELQKTVPLPAPRSLREDSNTSIIFEASAQVIAQQLTHLEQEGFRKISVYELRGQQWTKDNPAKEAPGLHHCIQHFNKLSFWCATEIVVRGSLKQRVSALKRVINIANCCFEYKNYNSALAILGCLGFAAIKRLKKTWKNLPSKYLDIYQQLLSVFDVETNYSRYKKLMVSEPPPMIPYIGLYLRDITFLELGNPDFLEDNIINYDKYRMISSILIDFRTYQEIPYPFEIHNGISRLLKNHMVTFDEDHLYDCSEKLEPRVRAVSSSGLSKRKKWL